MSRLRIQFTVSGNDVAAVTSQIQNLASVSEDDARRIVESFGVVAVFEDQREAERAKGQLEAAGAQAMIPPVEDFSLPKGSALNIPVEEDRQTLARARVSQGMSPEEFNNTLGEVETGEDRIAIFDGFADLFTWFFEKLLPFKGLMLATENVYLSPQVNRQGTFFALGMGELGIFSADDMKGTQ